MNFATEFMTHLPALRRYARALSGSQDVGDHAVALTLENLGLRAPAPGLGTNVTLFRILSDIWNDMNVEPAALLPRQASATSSVVDLRIASLGRLTRQAFLLTTMEHFSESDAAYILDLDQTHFAALLAEARIEVASQIRSRVLIIEDEFFIAMHLDGIMRELGHTVTDISRTHQAAVLAATRQPPDIVLADVQLADGSSGLEAVNDILEAIGVPVIFITAFPERLLSGTRPEPTFIMAKPFDAGMIRAVVSQALFFRMIARSGDGSGPRCSAA